MLYNECRKYGKFCVWDNEYPSYINALADFDADCLYVLTQNNLIIGTLSVVSKNELDNFDCWQTPNTEAKEIARIAISPAYQNQGIATQMVNNILTILKKEGFKAVRLSVAIKNVPALKVYQKLGFVPKQLTYLYNNDYYLMEKLLISPSHS